jgi:predicted permease
MITLNIWRAIGDFCTNVLFAPYNYIRNIYNAEHWWAANTINVILILIGILFFGYWLIKLQGFKKAGTE